MATMKVSRAKTQEIMENFLNNIEEIYIVGDSEKVELGFFIEDFSLRDGPSGTYQIFNETNIVFEDVPVDVYKYIEVEVKSARLTPSDVPGIFQFELDSEVDMEFPNGTITINNGDFIIETPYYD